MSDSNRIRLSRLSLALVLALAAAPAFAQGTSAVLGGRVVGADGQPVAGAEVTILHSESGTVSKVSTDADGRYSARGLRVGGPYTVTVNKAGAGTDTEQNVYLQLSSANNLNMNLVGATLDAVTVVGSGVESVFSPTKMGTGTNVGREKIEALPSATRNIQDYIRLDPRISQVSKSDGSISVGGQNTRYNVIKIDGVGASDPFGLEPNNLPTERQPVSMDALEAINISVAEYDVTIAGAVGGVINAVTKSGTNEFHGSVYGALRDGDWVRENLRGEKFAGFTSEETYGATFGGPILKDRLFFFVNYETYTKADPFIGLASTAYGSGRINDADIARFQAAARTNGFDAGALSIPSSDTTTEEYAVKLDWNINEDHRAALRYSKTEQEVSFFRNMGSSSISLSSYYQTIPKTFDSTVLELFSDWSENVSTEFKLSNRNYSSERVNNSRLPVVRVNGYSGFNSIYAGTEANSHVNLIDTEQLGAFAAVNWYVGDHVVKAGFDYEQNDIVNFFGRNLNGNYEFANIAAFEARTPSRYIVRVPVPGGNLQEDVPAAYGQENLGLFLQDTWTVNDNLTLIYGLRWDKPTFDAQPLHNTFIQGIYGYDNTYVPETSLLQPRFGFNYTFDSDRPTQLRGGVGLFQGGAPNVWIAGIYQNTGLNYLEYDQSNPGPVFTPNADSPYRPVVNDAACYPVPTLATCARQNVDMLEPGFKLPSSLKANLAFEHELPWQGVVFSAEYLHTWVENGIYLDRLDLYNQAGQGPTRMGPDGRMMFWRPGGYTPTTGNISSANSMANRPNGVGNVFLLRNTNKGASSQFTIGLDRPALNGWGWSAYYTRTAATEVSPLSNSINGSSWNGTLAGNVNANIANNSRYAIRDRFTGTINWERAFFGDYKTSVGLFFEGRSGRPFSYIYSNDMNGDGTTSLNDLFYVPKGPGDVVFTGGAPMEAAFFDWLGKHPEVAQYGGEIAPANGFRTGFTNNFDLRIGQELPGFFTGHKTKVSLDFLNVGNMLNKDWGLIEDYGFFSTARVASYQGICSAAVTALCPAGSNGKLVYNFRSVDQPQIQENGEDKGNQATSRWSVLATLRYEF